MEQLPPELVGRAIQDTEFRRRLLAEPEDVVAAEGYDLSESANGGHPQPGRRRRGRGDRCDAGRSRRLQVGLTGAHDHTARFYDRWTELFLRGFGPVFQAGTLRTGEPPRRGP
jgi:hypothetical protein